MTHGKWKRLSSRYDDALAKLPDALKAEGFGVVSQIDLAETLRTKIGKDVGRYRVLGACNPSFAFDAIGKDPQAGVLLPCNVVLYELLGEGEVMLGVIDPMQAVGTVPALEPLAREVGARLDRVLAAMT
jgi:uncharacterized protein (DUF302 family)